MLILLASATAGCDESVDPFVGDERPYTIWGFLDARADTQRVRVFTIEERLGTDRTGPIDATVISTDLATGERITWQDRPITFADSTTGHVFEAVFRPEPERAYHLDVIRSDGATSSAEVTIPPLIEIDFNPDTPTTRVPLYIRGNPPSLIGLQAVYEASSIPPSNAWPPGSPRMPNILLDVVISYQGKEERTDDGWRVDVNFLDDFQAIKQAFQEICVPTLLTMRRVEFQVFIANAEWSPPGGTFDPDVLVEPGALSNVKNGFGFFGGGYTFSERWLPPMDMLRNVGFSFEAPCSLGPRNVPECQYSEPCLDP